MLKNYKTRKNPYCYKFYQIEYKREENYKRGEYTIDKAEADFCLNCTKEKCNGNCKDYKKYMKDNKRNG